MIMQIPNISVGHLENKHVAEKDILNSELYYQSWAFYLFSSLLLVKCKAPVDTKSTELGVI